MADPTANLRTNILHDYTNYTYNLQLWWIPVGAFNKIAQGAIKVGTEPDILSGGKLLISDAGRSPAEHSEASTYFPTDFVIDNLVIDSVVGQKGSGARGVDTLQIKFDILEPYTVTLIDRLVLLSKELQTGQDFKSLIYCLRIQFFGYDELGRPTRIDEATKWIPFTFINMQFNITHRGATYQCHGIPMQNIALSALDNQVPFHVELHGQTMKDLFNSTSFEATDSVDPRNDNLNTVPNNGNTNVIKGIAEALNANEQFKVDRGIQTYANKYKFKIHPDLINAKIIDPANLSDSQRSNSSIRGADGGLQTVLQGKLGKLEQDPNNGAIRSAAGTKITELIMTILLTTDYMKKQVAAAGQVPDKTKPFNWIKIIPLIEIKNYDNKTNYFQREVTYVIKPYAYYGEDHPSIQQKAYPPGSLVKNYEYIYTGNNRDIIKVNLDYKIAFFDVRNSSKINTADQSGNSQGPDEAGANIQEQGTEIQNNEPFKAGINFKTGLRDASGNAPSDDDKKSLSLAEMVTKLFDNGVDLISLDIEIVGDPDWIQQDNVLYGPSVDDSTKTLNNGVINFQNGVTCFQFNFKSPVNDYDDITGLMKIDDDITSTASFSGTYQVLTVVSRFNKGKFTQSLTNVRLRLQKDSDTGQRPNQETTVVQGVNPSFVGI